MSEDTPPVACTIDEKNKPARDDQSRSELVPRYRNAEELDDGFTIRFDGTTETVLAVARFVQEEHLCCAFATYRIEISPPYDETRLVITGPDGTKDIFTEFIEKLDTAP